MNALYLAIGLLLLVAGRRLYWLFVGAMGFVAGLLLAEQFIAGQVTGANARSIEIVVALLGGVAGALLAVLFQKLAVALAGAVVGAFAGWVLLEAFAGQSIAWIGMIVGAILAGILVLRIFDWGLIVFSSIAGARVLVIDGMRMDWSQGALIFLVAVVVGVLLQGLQLVRAKKRAAAAERAEDRNV